MLLIKIVYSHCLDVLVHDADDLIHLRLLLSHFALRLDLSHVLRPWDGFAVGAERALVLGRGAARGGSAGLCRVRHLAAAAEHGWSQCQTHVRMKIILKAMLNLMFLDLWINLARNAIF